MLCDACGPDEGGASLVPDPTRERPDIVPESVVRSAMLDQGDDDMRWEISDDILRPVGADEAEGLVLQILRDVEAEHIDVFEGVDRDEWIGGGVNGGVKTGHAAAQNQASGGARRAMARALTT